MKFLASTVGILDSRIGRSCHRTQPISYSSKKKLTNFNATPTVECAFLGKKTTNMSLVHVGGLFSISQVQDKDMLSSGQYVTNHIPSGSENGHRFGQFFFGS